MQTLMSPSAAITRLPWLAILLPSRHSSSKAQSLLKTYEVLSPHYIDVLAPKVKTLALFNRLSTGATRRHVKLCCHRSRSDLSERLVPAYPQATVCTPPYSVGSTPRCFLPRTFTFGPVLRSTKGERPSTAGAVSRCLNETMTCRCG